MDNTTRTPAEIAAANAAWDAKRAEIDAFLADPAAFMDEKARSDSFEAQARQYDAMQADNEMGAMSAAYGL